MKAVLEYLQQELNEGWDTREEIAEAEKAIEELEAIQNRSCETCRYCTYDEYKENCFIIDACIKNEITLPDDFSCSEYERNLESEI